MKTMMSPPSIGPADPLTSARQAIDSLDDELLRLIERRFALSLRIAALKTGGDRRLKIRPRREAEVLRRLCASATTATPELICHVWRELMAHSVQAQVVTQLVVHAPGADADLVDRVRERFGRAAPVIQAASPAEAIECARDADEPALSIFDLIETGSGPVLLLGRIAAEDIQPGHGVAVRDVPAGEVLASAGSLHLCREGGR